MADAGVQQIDGIVQAKGTADIVVGILSYNNSGTIGAIVRDAQESLVSGFPGRRGIVVLADGGSRDGTQESAMASAVNKDDFLQITYPVFPAQKIAPEYYGVPGKANGVRAIFGAAGELKTAAWAILDSTTSIPARGWVEALVQPVIDDGIDLVLPTYPRHKYEATILNGILYPLGRALYGKKIHPPISGQYALSGRLVSHLANQQGPSGETTSSGTDAWITVQALCGDFRPAEVVRGPGERRPSGPAPEVSAILAQALGSGFSEMNRSAACWQRIRGSQLVTAYGPRLAPPADPSPVDPAPMLQSFLLGYQNLQDIYRLVLPPSTMMELKHMSLNKVDTFHFDGKVWARIIYDFALAWRMRVMDRDHLLGALTPLYLGWVASWVRAVRNEGPKQVQDRIESLCMDYETQKGYLISRWRWPDRFNP
jgi:hypothetical protein